MPNTQTTEGAARMLAEIMPTAWAATIDPARIPTAAQQAEVSEAISADVADLRLINISGWGDSETAGTNFQVPYLTALRSLFGGARNTFNFGVGGETATQIEARFQATPARWNDTTIIWIGRNTSTAFPDTAWPNEVIAKVASIVATLGHDRYIVIGVTKGDYVDERGNGAKGQNINLINASLSATYGPRFFNANAFFLTLGNGSPQDNIDIADGIPPASGRVDALHFTTAFYAALAGQLYPIVLGLESVHNKAVTLDRVLQILSAPPGIGGSSPSIGAFTNLTLTGQMLAAGGSGSSPGMSFATDTNTGFVGNGADSVFLSLGGILQFRWLGTSMILTQTGRISWTSGASAGDSIECGFQRVAANTIGFVGVGAAYWVYNANSTTNYTRAGFKWSGNIAILGTGKGGTGIDGGMSIGESTQLLGFFGAVPIARPASASQAVATDAASALVLVNQLRADLVGLGIIKGSA